jgi:hypothetical protein
MSGYRDRAYERSSKCTSAQVKYIEGLLIDCGYGGSIVQRNAMLSREFERDIKYIQELTTVEASRLIEQLKDQKNRNKPSYGKANDEKEDDWYKHR